MLPLTLFLDIIGNLLIVAETLMKNGLCTTCQVWKDIIWLGVGERIGDGSVGRYIDR